MRRIDAAVVAVPARNEERRLPAALAAIRDAVSACPVAVVVAVAADACTDRTADVAAEHGATVVEVGAARIGAARAAAVAAGLRAVAHPAGRVWVATTDADSRVPAGWLVEHLRLAERGAALVRGTVRPDPHELAAEHLSRWFALHRPSDLHDHVYGANLGVRGDVYTAAGGFPDVPADEDVSLVRAVEADGWRAVSTDRAPVVTSARLIGRAPRGFAAYLRERVVLPDPDGAASF